MITNSASPSMTLKNNFTIASRTHGKIATAAAARTRTVWTISSKHQSWSLTSCCWNTGNDDKVTTRYRHCQASSFIPSHVLMAVDNSGLVSATAIQPSDCRNHVESSSSHGPIGNDATTAEAAAARGYSVVSNTGERIAAFASTKNNNKQ